MTRVVLVIFLLLGCATHYHDGPNGSDLSVVWGRSEIFYTCADDPNTCGECQPVHVKGASVSSEFTSLVGGLWGWISGMIP